MKDKSFPKEISKLGMVMNFGIIVVSNVTVAAFIGYYLDKVTLNNKLILVIFLFLGIISGMYNGVRYLMKELKKLEEKAKR